MPDVALRGRRDAAAERPPARPPEAEATPSGGGRVCRSKRLTRLGLALLALALVGLAVARPALVLPPAGRFLVAADPPARADAIVVLAGEVLAERGFAARDLYLAGAAPRVLLSPDVRPRLADALERLGIPVALQHEITGRMLTASGVPPAAVERLPPAQNTAAEARTVARLARERRWSSVIVVTSRTHTRRACWTFRRVVGDAVTIHCAPTPYDPFDPDRWWQDGKMALQVANEYGKLAASFLDFFAQ
ncbi:MAG TPA: YdcF family protein [Methylomirabilota bacterium]|jgi:uncharacterized SAM-binding protein YcdF (DUF218 family)|nr:YdcF family protein [Methylomirabilota bacterium]